MCCTIARVRKESVDVSISFFPLPKVVFLHNFFADKQFKGYI